MSFLLSCPNCGPRDVNEFAYAGEVTVRPKGSPSRRELSSYLYFRRNVAGIQREWWCHRLGCQRLVPGRTRHAHQRGAESTRG